MVVERTRRALWQTASPLLESRASVKDTAPVQAKAPLATAPPSSSACACGRPPGNATDRPVRAPFGMHAACFQANQKGWPWVLQKACCCVDGRLAERRFHFIYILNSFVNDSFNSFIRSTAYAYHIRLLLPLPTQSLYFSARIQIIINLITFIMPKLKAKVSARRLRLSSL